MQLLGADPGGRRAFDRARRGLVPVPDGGRDAGALPVRGRHLLQHRIWDPRRPAGECTTCA